MRVGGQRHAPAALPPEMRPGTYRIGGWVVPQGRSGPKCLELCLKLASGWLETTPNGWRPVEITNAVIETYVVDNTYT